MSRSQAFRPLRTIAEWNPVSAITQATRELFGTTNRAFPPPDVWPLQPAVLASLLWITLLLAVFIPTAIRRYHVAVTR